MSLPSVYETEGFPIAVSGNGQAPQSSQKPGILAAVLRHKLLIFATLALGLGLGYLQFTKTQVLYRSTAKIMMISRQLPMMHMAGGITYQDQLSTQMELATSPKIILLALDPPFVDPNEANPLVEIRTPTNLRSLESFSGVSNPVAFIVENTAASRVNNDVFELSFTGPNSQDCKLVLDEMIAAYKAALIDQYADTGKELLDLLKVAQVTLEEELENRQLEYRNFVAESELVSVGDEAINRHSQRLTAIINQQSLIESQLLDVNASIRAVEEFRDSPDGNLEAFQKIMEGMPFGEVTSKDAALVSRREQLEIAIEDLEFEDQQLSYRLGVDHPDRQRKRGEIELLQQRVQDIEEFESAPQEDKVAMWLEALHAQKQIVESQRATLDAEFDSESEEARGLKVAELEDARLRAGVDRAQQLYDSVLHQIDEIELMDDLDRVHMDLLAKPVDGVRIQPVFATIMTAAGALGLLLGVVIAYLLERADGSFRSPEDVRGALSVSVLAHIPVFPDRMRLKSPDSKIDQGVWCFHKPGGSIAESFKGIRTSLQFGRREGIHQVIMITSPSPGEGKSTITANLAVSLAHLGKRVLIVDADRRRAMQSRMFGLMEQPGLTEILTDDVEPFDVIQETEVAGLSMLASGKKPRNPSELLCSPRMSELVKVLREQFDYVLIDTPPALVVTDPLAVAPLADAIIGVLRLSRRTRNEATATIERLQEVGGDVMGVIVNGLEAGMGYGSGYGVGGYHYSFGYGYDFDDDYGHEENGVHTEEPRRITAS